MKKIMYLLTIFITIFMFTACDNFSLLHSGPEGGSYGFPTGGSGGTKNRPKPGAGQLTSGEWSDLKNYDFYLDLFKNIEDPDTELFQSRNIFSQFKKYFGFETRYLFMANVICSGILVADAHVELYDSDDEKLFTAKTDARGNAFLFPSYDLTNENITIRVNSGGYETVMSFENTHNNIQITLENHASIQNILDIMFVIDTTGSMGDEIKYLKSEIADVIDSVSRDNPAYTINLALLFYRDLKDEYITRYSDFTTDIAKQQQFLAKQSASGGGDFPEAVDIALQEAVEKNWNDDYAARLIFHVCDARPHNNKERQGSEERYFDAIKTAAEKGIRIIPVASSGIDNATEYLLRQEALMTGGTYIFLTDDSGIGNSHLEPSVGEFDVEYLNACMVRIVNEYITGTETKPVPYY